MSKAMSYLLRHGLIKEKLTTVTSDGYVQVDEVISWLRSKGHHLTISDVVDIVRADSKNRFALDESHMRIRANQGHSISVEVDSMCPYLLDNQVLHCTSTEHISSIAQGGLSRMSRTHIHMIKIDGSSWHMCRSNSDLYVFIDTEKARAAGHEFLISANGVILCATTIQPEFLTFCTPAKSPCYGFIIKATNDGSVCCVRTPRDQWGFPKGKCKKGELPIACALRELKEETGLSFSDITILPGAVTEITDKGNNCTTYFYATVSTTLALQAQDPEELSEVVWCLTPPAGMLERRRSLWP
jgi:RNA:NAD 2'-phosphotransferase (TPT1/KptA family)/ADP-ribose pyrophosphatase YjhB (NUDIX family)